MATRLGNLISTVRYYGHFPRSVDIWLAKRQFSLFGFDTSDWSVSSPVALFDLKTKGSTQ